MKRNVWHGNNASVRLKKKSGHWPVYEQHDKSMGWNETQKCQPCHVPPLPCQPIAPGVLQRNSGFAANFLSEKYGHRVLRFPLFRCMPYRYRFFKNHLIDIGIFHFNMSNRATQSTLNTHQRSLRAHSENTLRTLGKH